MGVPDHLLELPSDYYATEVECCNGHGFMDECESGYYCKQCDDTYEVEL